LRLECSTKSNDESFDKRKIIFKFIVKIFLYFLFDILYKQDFQEEHREEIEILS